MIPVRTNFLLAAALLIGQLGLNACQSQTDTVLPDQMTVAAKKATVSDWIAINTDAWTISPKGSQMHVAGFVDSTVTNSVVEQGLVVAFYRNSATGDVYTLPVTIEGRSISFTYYAMSDKGIVSFQQETGQPTAGQYRWVVVPKEAASGVNWTDYDAVKRALRLDE